MKVALWAFALCGLSAVAMADQPPAAPTHATEAVEHYQYGMKLDVAQVLAQDRVPEVCGTVPVHMTYLDSRHQQHVMEYLVMGNGCNNG